MLLIQWFKTQGIRDLQGPTSLWALISHSGCFLTPTHPQHSRFQDKWILAQPSDTKHYHLSYGSCYSSEILPQFHCHICVLFSSVSSNPSLGYLPGTLDPLGLLLSCNKGRDFNLALKFKACGAVWGGRSLAAWKLLCLPAGASKPSPLCRLPLTP